MLGLLAQLCLLGWLAFLIWLGLLGLACFAAVKPVKQNCPVSDDRPILFALLLPESIFFLLTSPPLGDAVIVSFSMQPARLSRLSKKCTVKDEALILIGLLLPESMFFSSSIFYYGLVVFFLNRPVCSEQ